MEMWDLKLSKKMLTRFQDQPMSFPKSFKEFEVNFSLSQRVHVMRKKLNYALCTLKNTQNTVFSIRSLLRKLTQKNKLAISQFELFEIKLKNVFNELDNYFSMTTHLLRFSEDIRVMVRLLLVFMFSV